MEYDCLCCIMRIYRGAIEGKRLRFFVTIHHCDFLRGLGALCVFFYHGEHRVHRENSFPLCSRCALWSTTFFSHITKLIS